MIFVSIASFCDPFLETTLRDAVAKAKQPKDITFGVVDQTTVNRRTALKNLCNPAQLRYMHIDPIESRGVCWARALAFTFYQGESFFLQIDSHMLFEPHWDEQLITQLQSLKSRSDKPIVSTYPFAFEFENGEPIIKTKIGDKTTLVLRPHPETTLTDENATLRFRAEHVFTLEPVLGCHVAGGFIFTAGNFIEEVPYDARLYFHGEEQSLAVRSFTRGWDIFHPPHIPLFHLYKKPNTPHLTHHWHPEWEQQRDFKRADLSEAAKQRLMDLVFEKRDLGIYGLGKTRTLHDFAKLSGVDYAHRKIIQPYQATPYFDACD